MSCSNSARLVSLTFSTAGIPDIARDLHTTPLVATLGVTTYVLGFAFGPLVWAPLSEARGRRPVYLISWFVFTISQIPCALAKNPGMCSPIFQLIISYAHHLSIDCWYIRFVSTIKFRRFFSRHLAGPSPEPQSLITASSARKSNVSFRSCPIPRASNWACRWRIPFRIWYDNKMIILADRK